MSQLIIALVGCCSSIWATHNTSCLLLQPTNSPLLVWPGQTDSSGAERLIMPAKQITSEQPLVEIAQANGDI